jgi:hypothetical protein
VQVAGLDGGWWVTGLVDNCVYSGVSLTVIIEGLLIIVQRNGELLVNYMQGR